MTSKTWLTAAAAAAAAMLPPATAAAVTCSGAFGTFNFGVYTGAATSPSTNQGSITCPSGFQYSIGLSAGAGPGATVSQRMMTGPNSITLNYQLFQDSAHALNWGDTSGVDTPAAVGTGAGQPIAVYGRIPAGQNVPPGTYQDTVTVSVLNSSPLATFTATNVAVIAAACTLSASPLAFGSYSGTQDDVATTVTATCTSTTPYDIALSAGNGVGATVSARAMTGPSSASLGYALYRDSARTLSWGVTTGTDTLPGAGTGTAVAIPVYGRIVSGLAAIPGAYADTVVATIIY